MKRLLVLLALLISMQSSYALELYDLDCFNDGHATIILSGNNESKAYTKDIKLTVDNNQVEGSWSSLFIKKTSIMDQKYGTFTSKEGIFKEKNTYNINVDYVLVENSTASYKETISFPIECPGLLFSCTILNLSVSDCYNQEGIFTAIINAQGLMQSKDSTMQPDKVISFTIRSKNNYIDKNNFNSKEGDLPANYTISSIGNDNYKLEFELDANTVNSMFIEFNDELFKPCNRNVHSKVKYYDLKECSLKPPQDEIQDEKNQVKGQEIKSETEASKSPENIIPVTKEDLNPKNIVILSATVLLIGIVIIYWLKRREITS